jgi:hypothetical protein
MMADDRICPPSSCNAAEGMRRRRRYFLESRKKRHSTETGAIAVF